MQTRYISSSLFSITRRCKSTFQPEYLYSQKISALPEGEVKDMSIHGLCLNSVALFIKGALTPRLFQQSGTLALGRWKVGIDNFAKGKSYDYDHSA